MGYALLITGEIDGQKREFSIGIGKAAYVKYEFRIGNIISGDSHPVLDNRTEVVEFYKVSKLQIIDRSDDLNNDPPPWIDVPPTLEIYRQRGHRRLEVRTYKSKAVHLGLQYAARNDYRPVETRGKTVQN